MNQADNYIFTEDLQDGMRSVVRTLQEFLVRSQFVVHSRVNTGQRHLGILPPSGADRFVAVQSYSGTADNNAK
jgi:hypothetical protein